MVNGPLIGLVEDDDHDFRAIERAFGSSAQLRRWSNGEDLIASILSEAGLLQRLSLLLLDLTLPGIDGVHVAHTVRTAPGGAELPVVVLSGSAAEHDILRALEAEVTEYEVKPSNVADLRAFVARTLSLLSA